jgi:hypothetical protein
MLKHQSRNGLLPILWIVLFFFLVTAIGCGRRTANPILGLQFGDRKKSCEALELEMSQIQQEITRLLPDTEKTAKNVILGIAGLWLIVPWFFMDFTEAEEMEINAFRQRHNQLGLIALDKGCAEDYRPIVMPEPKGEADEDEYEE